MTDPRPLAVVPIVVTVLACFGVSVRLAAARDVDAGTLAGQDSAAPRLASVQGPVPLAVRLMRPVALGWLFGVLAMSVLIGATAESSTRDSTGSGAVGAAVRRLGGDGGPVELYLGLTFLVLALLVAMIAAGQVAALAAEETDGHLQNLLVRPLHRLGWLAGRLGLAVTLLVVGSLTAGFGAWAWTAGQHAPPLRNRSGLRLPGLVGLIQFTAGLAGINHWLMDTSIFSHTVPAPARDGPGPDRRRGHQDFGP